MPPSTMVSPSEARTVVCTVWMLNAGALMPLPRLTGVGLTLETVGSTRMMILPSGVIRGVTRIVTPISW